MACLFLNISSLFMTIGIMCNVRAWYTRSWAATRLTLELSCFDYGGANFVAIGSSLFVQCSQKDVSKSKDSDKDMLEQWKLFLCLFGFCCRLFSHRVVTSLIPNFFHAKLVGINAYTALDNRREKEEGSCVLGSISISRAKPDNQWYRLLYVYRRDRRVYTTDGRPKKLEIRRVVFCVNKGVEQDTRPFSDPSSSIQQRRLLVLWLKGRLPSRTISSVVSPTVNDDNVDSKEQGSSSPWFWQQTYLNFVERHHWRTSC